MEGHVLTWGKGRYGRLGHADSEDQLKPKVVEMLLGYRAVDIACGSGDAQTLCITDDGNDTTIHSCSELFLNFIYCQTTFGRGETEITANLAEVDQMDVKFQ